MQGHQPPPPPGSFGSGWHSDEHRRTVHTALAQSPNTPEHKEAHRASRRACGQPGCRALALPCARSASPAQNTRGKARAEDPASERIRQAAREEKKNGRGRGEGGPRSRNTPRGREGDAVLARGKGAEVCDTCLLAIVGLSQQVHLPGRCSLAHTFRLACRPSLARGWCVRGRHLTLTPLLPPPPAPPHKNKTWRLGERMACLGCGGQGRHPLHVRVCRGFLS